MSFAGISAGPRLVRRPEIMKEKALGNLLDAGFPYSRSFVMSPTPDSEIMESEDTSVRIDLSWDIPPA